MRIYSLNEKPSYIHIIQWQDACIRSNH